MPVSAPVRLRPGVAAGGFLSFVLLAAAPLGAQTKFALVAEGGAGDSIKGVLDLATARISADAGIALLERAEIARVLAEQKLSLAGLVDAEKAIAAGKILGTDLFAAVEAAPTDKQALGVVVFDAATGLRLADETLPAGAEAAADGISSAVRAAVAKRGQLRSGLRPVCFLSVRNADLPREMDSVLQSVGLLLERSLVKAPGVAVLERKRLAHVNQERQLAGAAEQGLWSSLVVVELEIGKAAEGTGWRATALLTDGSGKLLQRVTGESPQGNPSETSAALIKQLAAALNAAPPPTTVPSAREADRHALESVLLHAHGDFQQAIGAAEAACSLAPDRGDYRINLSRFLVDLARDLLNPRSRQNAPANNDKPGLPSVATVDPQNVAPAIAYLSRAADLRYEIFCERNPALPQGMRDYHTTHYLSQGYSLNATLRMFERVTLLSNGERQAQFELREKCRQLSLKTARAWADLVKTSPELIYIYSSVLRIQWIPYLASFSRNSDEFYDTLEQFYRQWLEAVTAAGPIELSDDVADVGSVLGALHMPSIASSLNREFGVSASEHARRLEPLFQAMREHSHPVVRLYGAFGPLQTAKQAGTLMLSEIERRLQPIFDEAVQLLEKPEPWPARQVRRETYLFLQSCVQGLYHPSGIQQVRDVGPPRARRLVSLCNVMLKRGELYYPLVSDANFSIKKDFATEAYESELLQVVEQIQAAIDRPGTEFIDCRVESVRTSLDKIRLDIMTRIAGDAVESGRAWHSARKVFECGPQIEISQIQRGVVSNGTLYCIGARARNGRHSNVQCLERAFTRRSACRRFTQNTGGCAGPPTADRVILVRARYGSWATRICAAIAGLGVAIFPLDGSSARVLNAANGLPTSEVRSLAVLDRVLYIGLEDGGYLIKHELNSGRNTIVASAARREEITPLDNTGNLLIGCLMADLDRARVLMAAYVDRRDAIHDRRNGIWQIDGKSGALTQLHQLSGYQPLRWSSQILNSRILFSGLSYVLNYDCRSNELTLLYSPIPRTLKPGQTIDRKDPPLQISAPPLVWHDDWLWTGSGFKRFSPRDQAIEFLPKIDANDSWPPQYLQCLHILPDKEQMVVASDRRVWLLDLSKP